jgi:hypothetical protein
MEITHLTREHDGALTRFLDALGADSPSVLGYHYPFYRDVLDELGVGTPHYLGVLDAAGELLACLPGFVRRTEVGTVYSSLPFFGPNAGVLCRPERAAELQGPLLGAALAFVRSQPNPLSASFYTPLLGPMEGYDSALPQALVVERFTQYQALDKVDSERKYDVRKADASGVVVTHCPPEHWDALYDLYADNCREFGIPLKPRAAVRGLLERGGERVRSYLAWREGALVAGLILLQSPQTVSYYLPALRSEARVYQPTVKLIDHAMRQARASGRRYWNWESSPGRQSGVYFFKRKWGAVESRYRIYVHLLCPEERLRGLGRDRLEQAFPYFFVYPNV